MAGILETMAIGGAAWGAMEKYREDQERSKVQKELVTELFAKYFGKDFMQLAPDRTTKALSLPSGTDPDISSAYHFICQYQDSRTRSLIQDLWYKEEQRGDILTMICEYFKSWLAGLPKGDAVRSSASAEVVDDVRKHVEFGRQLLMRPKLFRLGTVSSFNVAVAHFCEHTDKFCERLISAERNASHCIDTILTVGIETIQLIFPVLMFTLSHIYKADAKSERLPRFDSGTLLRNFENSCMDESDVAGANPSGDTSKSNDATPTGQDRFKTAYEGNQSGRNTSALAIAVENSTLMAYDPSSPYKASGIGTMAGATAGMLGSRKESIIAWTSHVGKLLYLLISTPHYSRLMGEEVEEEQSPFEAFRSNGNASGRRNTKQQTVVEEAMKAQKLQKEKEEQAKEEIRREAEAKENERKQHTVEKEKEEEPRQQREKQTKKDGKSSSPGSPKAQCYVSQADVDGGYLAGYNWEPTEEEIERERKRKEKEAERERTENTRKTATGIWAGLNPDAKKLENTKSSESAPDYHNYYSAVGSSSSTAEPEKKVDTIFTKPIYKSDFKKRDFREELDYVRRQWEIFLRFKDSGLLPPFAKPNNAGLEAFRRLLLALFEQVDNFIYFLSVLSIYAKLSNLAGDPIVIYLASPIHQLLQELDLILGNLQVYTGRLIDFSKQSLQNFSKVPKMLSENDLRWMSGLHNLDSESLRANYKKLLELFTQLRSLSATDRVGSLKNSIENNLRSLGAIMNSGNFLQRCRLGNGIHNPQIANGSEPNPNTAGISNMLEGLSQAGNMAATGRLPVNTIRDIDSPIMIENIDGPIIEEIDFEEDQTTVGNNKGKNSAGNKSATVVAATVVASGGKNDRTTITSGLNSNGLKRDRSSGSGNHLDIDVWDSDGISHYSQVYPEDFPEELKDHVKSKVSTIESKIESTANSSIDSPFGARRSKVENQDTPRSNDLVSHKMAEDAYGASNDQIILAVNDNRYKTVMDNGEIVEFSNDGSTPTANRTIAAPLPSDRFHSVATDVFPDGAIKPSVKNFFANPEGTVRSSLQQAPGILQNVGSDVHSFFKKIGQNVEKKVEKSGFLLGSGNSGNSNEPTSIRSINNFSHSEIAFRDALWHILHDGETYNSYRKKDDTVVKDDTISEEKCYSEEAIPSSELNRLDKLLQRSGVDQKILLLVAQFVFESEGTTQISKTGFGIMIRLIAHGQQQKVNFEQLLSVDSRNQSALTRSIMIFAREPPETVPGFENIVFQNGKVSFREPI